MKLRASPPCPIRSVTSRVWMDRRGQGVGRRRDARNEVLQICVSNVHTCAPRVAETHGEHVAACPVMVFVDRVAKGFCRPERLDLRRRDGDRLPGSGIASLTCGATSDGELPEARNGDRLVPCERAGDGGGHGAQAFRSAAALVVQVSAATCETGSALVMLSFPAICGRTPEDGASPG